MAAYTLYDRVHETCSAPGTSTVTLLGAVTGYQSFAVVGDSNSCFYCIADQSGTNWEVGIGTYTLSGTTLARNTVLASSNSNTLVNFSSGTQDVFLPIPAAYDVQATGTTANYLARWTTTNALVNSLIQDNGLNINITAAVGTAASGATPATAAGTVMVIGGTGGRADTTAGGTASRGATVSISGGTGGNGAASTNGPANGGNLSLTSGNAGLIASGFGGANGGNVSFDVGLGSGTGSNGDLFIGAYYANIILIGGTAYYPAAVQIQGGTGQIGSALGGSAALLGGTGFAATVSVAAGAGAITVIKGGAGGAGFTSVNGPGAGGELELLGGAAGAYNSYGGANGGPIVVDAGASSGSGSNGTVSIGTSIASSVTIGRTGVTTTINGTLALANDLTVSNGGTGAGTFTAYALICAGTTSTGAFQNVSGLGTAGYVLVSAGAGALPAWSNTIGATGVTTTINGTLDLANALAVPEGGTGGSSFTAYTLVCAGATSTGAFQNVTSVGTTGQVLTSNGASALPTFQTVPGSNPGPAQTRLTYTQGTPVTTSDVTAATSLYIEPLVGNIVWCYTSSWSALSIPGSTYSIGLTQTATGVALSSGTKNVTVTSTAQLVVGMQVTGTGVAGSSTIASINSATQITLNNTPSTEASVTLTFKLPASTLYNVYLVNVSGTPQLRFGAASGEAITTSVGGIYTNTSAVVSSAYTLIAANNGTYLGTIYTSTTAGQGEDAVAARYLWNYYNRKLRYMSVTDGGVSFTYSSGAWQQWRTTNTYQLNFVVGVVEDIAVARSYCPLVQPSSSGTSITSVGVGLNSTTVNSAQLSGAAAGSASSFVPPSAFFSGYPTAGYNYLAFLQYSTSADTITWYSTGESASFAAGISGEVWG